MPRCCTNDLFEPYCVQLSVPRPVAVVFHGNGETASDYEQIGPTFNWLGFHLMVVDYRGYGWSTANTPLMSRLLSDAEPLVARASATGRSALDDALDAAGVPPAHSRPAG